MKEGLNHLMTFTKAKRIAARLLPVTIASGILVAGCSTQPSTGPADNASTTTTHTPIATHKPAPLPVFNGPLPGYLMIADRGNDRILIVTPQKKIVWSLQMHVGGPSGANSLGADDTFFTQDKTHIITNEEDNHYLSIIDIRTKQTTWQYGHAGQPGSAPGYLHTPDDAYDWPNGLISTADIRNQRILFINPKTKQVVKQYGVTGLRYHNPPKSFAAPNGDTPLPDGGMLITEIGGSYADRLDKHGKLVYTVHFPDIAYPSDTQLLPNGNLLVADYSTPGRVEIVTNKGKLVWEWYHTSGPNELANPSLAIALPNGNIAVNDDSNDRVIIINPKTNKIVWQYGHFGVPGTAPGYLNTPDGMDLATPAIIAKNNGFKAQ